MAREGRSHVRKRKKGCLVGCLTNLMLLLGVIALVFVGAHVLGFVESDPQTARRRSSWTICRKSGSAIST